MQRFLSLFTRAKNFYREHERAIIIFALVSGFIIDNLTLRRIDLLFENLVFIFYILLGGAAILFINIYDAKKIAGKIADWLRLVSPVLLQFAFGGLFSAFFIFYFRSASVGASWPFIIFLLLMMIGNEIFAHKFSELTFQVSVYFVVVFSFFIFYVPILVGKIASWVFLLSAIVSSIFIYLFIRLIQRIYPQNFISNKKYIFRSIVAILATLILLYFLNIIPPIPLSVKEKVIAYNVTRLSNGDYEVLEVPKRWYDGLLSKQIAYLAPGEPLYVFSSIFAPTRLSTDVVHEWQVKTSDGWQTTSRIEFPLTGGADRGYRGYTFKYNLYPGIWRVNIETTRGATIGRIKFEIQSTETRIEGRREVY